MTIAEGGTHGHLDQDTLSSCLIGVLDRTTDPVVRQHLIFHIAVFLPADTAFPRLRSLATGDGGGDAEDALCALAFRGDPDAVRGFQALALRPAPVDCHRLVGVGEHDCLAEAGERELLRAWRCIEALQGNPYFALHDRVSDAWRFVGPPPEDDALAREILPAWLVRYEGHPGSDDMALRLSRIAWTRGNAGEAIRWASRAATLPDADVQGPAAALLAAEAEQAPLTDVLPDPGDPERNRNLLSYVRLRRIAVERGFAAAFDELRTVASREPRLPLSECFRHRLAEPPPRGVAGGAFPPAGDDPLLRIEGERLPDLPLVHPLREFDRGSEPTPRDDDPPGERDRSQDRLLPSMEPVRLPPRRLAFQFRCWETLAELERRADRATSVEASADLVYRQGAILFHERDALFPLQAPWRIHGSGRPWPLATAAAPFGEDERDLDWCRRNLPRLRAADLFERVLGMGPASPVAERAAYSLGLSLVMAAREPPLLDGRNLAVEIPGPRSLLEGAVEAFDRCARENPGSPLGLDAAGLAARWRERLRREIDE